MTAAAARRPGRAVGAAGIHASGAAAEWLTVDEACRIVKIGRRTFERYLSRGTGPRVKRIGKSRNSPIRIRRDWLDEWMEDGAA